MSGSVRNAVVSATLRCTLGSTLASRKRRTSSRKARSSRAIVRSMARSSLNRRFDEQTLSREVRIRNHAGIAMEMVARAAEEDFISDQAFDIAADRQLVRRADRAVKLDRLLAHGARRAPDFCLGAGAGTRTPLGRAIEAERREEARSA